MKGPQDTDETATSGPSQSYLSYERNPEALQQGKDVCPEWLEWRTLLARRTLDNAQDAKSPGSEDDFRPDTAYAAHSTHGTPARAFAAAAVQSAGTFTSVLSPGSANVALTETIAGLEKLRLGGSKAAHTTAEVSRGEEGSMAAPLTLGDDEDVDTEFEDLPARKRKSRRGPLSNQARGCEMKKKWYMREDSIGLFSTFT